MHWFIGGVEASLRLHLFMWRRGGTWSVGGVEAFVHFEAWWHLFILRHCNLEAWRYLFIMRRGGLFILEA